MNRVAPLLLVVLLSLLLLPAQARAQPRTGTSIYVALGVGYSAPDDDSKATGSGFYGAVEYVRPLSRWIGLRPYAGVQITSPDDEDPRCAALGLDCEVTAKIGFVGAKLRLALPIPYIAPYFEVGAGASVGTLRTLTPETDKEVSGVTAHIPVTLGLAFGSDHNYELAFAYLYHSSADQFDGAVAFGFSIPLKR